MKLNFKLVNQKKNKEKENSKLLKRILIEYFSDYFENVEFDYNFGREGFTFLAKEVEFRRDLLQRFGIPLELSIGRIKVIKLTVKSLLTLKNFSMNISDIDIEAQTIHISKNYKKNYLNYIKKYLSEWENKHKKFFNRLAKHSIFESFVIDRLIPIKVDIRNVNIKLNDSISSKHAVKQLEIKIDHIHSLGCNSKWDEIEEVEKDDIVYRTLEINAMSAQFNKIDKDNVIPLGTFLNEFNVLVKVCFLRTFKTTDLRVTPKMKVEIIFITGLLINLSVTNINILQNLVTYVTKVKKVEKYWVNRPEFQEEGKINKNESHKWFLYAFRVLREEIKNNKRQTYESLVDRLISMEKYIQYYKESHKLIIAPWIHQKDHKIELENLETKMNLDDIIFCRELSFAELLTEGRAFCASGEVGEGYKPFVHLWEFYVNDLRTKWMNKGENEVNTIKLSDHERRELMAIWKKDRDKVLLSYIKGEPNHPEDILFECDVKVNMIIINFSRNVAEHVSGSGSSSGNSTNNVGGGSGSDNTYNSFVNFTIKRFNEKTKPKILELNFVNQISQLKESEIEKYLKDEIQNDNNYDSDDEAMQVEDFQYKSSHGDINTNTNNLNAPSIAYNTSLTNKELHHHNSSTSQRDINTTTHHKNTFVISNNNNNDEDSCIYIDEININNDDDITSNTAYDNIAGNNNNNANNRLNDIGYAGNTRTTKGVGIGIGIDNMKGGILKHSKNKKVFVSKALFSLFLFSTNLEGSAKRNGECKAYFDIVSMHLLDHNYSFINVNKKTHSLEGNYGRNDNIAVKLIHTHLLNEEKNKPMPELKESSDIQKQLEERLIIFLIDIIKDQKSREILLKPYFPDENRYFNLYEDSFGMKKCEAIGQGLLSSKTDFTKIVIDYLIKKNIFNDVEEKMLKILSSKLKKKIEKFNDEEKNDLLKKIIIKKYEEMINPDGKKLYEKGVQENYIHTMVNDLNSVFQITSSYTIKEIISNFYPYHLKDQILLKILAEQVKVISDHLHLQPHKDNKQFFNLNLRRKGREYPNYIMKRKDDKIINNDTTTTTTNMDEPCIKAKIEMNSDINFKITNELLSELQLILPEIAQHESYSYVGNILNDLTRSYLSIFDDFRQIRAKLGVLNNIENKFRNANNNDDPIEMVYLDNLTKHLTELSNGNVDVTIKHNKTKTVKIFIYDKIHFINDKRLSHFGVILQGITLTNGKYIHNDNNTSDNNNNNNNNNNTNNESKQSIHANSINNSGKLPLPNNYKLSKVAKLLYQATLCIEKINIVIDKNNPIIQTDISVNMIYSLMKNTLFIPDRIIDAHTNSFEVSLYPCVIKLLKNQEHIKFYQDLYAVSYKMLSKEKQQAIDGVTKVIKNNFKRFISNLTTFLGDNCTYDSVDKDSKLKNLEYYLEKRNNSIIVYTIGNSGDSKRSFIINIYSKDSQTLTAYQSNQNNTMLDVNDFNSDAEFKLAKTQVENTNDVGMLKRNESIFSVGYNMTGININRETQRKSTCENGKENSSNILLFNTSNQLLFGNNNNNNITNSSNPYMKIYQIKNRSNVNVCKGSNSLLNGENNKAFCSFGCDFLMFNSTRNLFYERSQVWICPIETLIRSAYISFKIKLKACEPFTFSSNEYIFCKSFINALKANEIEIGQLSKHFPYDNTVKLRKRNFNCVFKKTTFFYEEFPELRSIYLNHFKGLIHNYEMAKYSHYLSNVCVNLDEIALKLVFKNNRDVINLYTGFKSNLNQYVFQSFENNYVSKRKKESDGVMHDCNCNCGGSGSSSGINEYMNEIGVHVNEIQINKITIKVLYSEIENGQPQEGKINDNPEICVSVKTVKYIENSYALNDNNNDNDDNDNDNGVNNINNNSNNVLKANLFILNILCEIVIPKNFDNEMDFSSLERIPIIDPSYIKHKFTTMKTDTQTQDEKIILNIQSISLKHYDEHKVQLEISNAIKFGFCHNIKSNDIDEWIFWVFPYSNGNESEHALIKARLSEIPNTNNVHLDSEFKKSITITFDKVDPHINDNELLKYQATSHFALFNKMIYIINSTFAYKRVYEAKARINIASIDIPSRVYDYLYYIMNWKRIITEMIRDIQKSERDNNVTDEESADYDSMVEGKYKSMLSMSDDNELGFIKENEKNANNNVNACNNEDFVVPLDGEKSVVLFIEGQMLFVTVKQHQIAFSKFIFLKYNFEMFKNSNNEELLYFSACDLNWKVLDSRYHNLFLKKNYNDYNSKMFEMNYVLSNANALNAKNKIQHPFLIEFHDCTFIFLMKYLNEIFDFLDYNEECLIEFPLVDEIHKLFPSIINNTEMFYFVFTDLSVVLPESSQSANYAKFDITNAVLKVSKSIERSKMIELSSSSSTTNNNAIYVIDKKTLFGFKGKEIDWTNTKINNTTGAGAGASYLNDLSDGSINNCNNKANSVELNKDKEPYFYITDIESKFTGIKSEIIVNGIKHDFLIAKEICLQLKSPKSLHPLTRLYHYYWKTNAQKVVRLNNHVVIALKDGKCTMTMGNFYSIDHFIDNNFDEYSTLFPVKEPKFNYVEFDVHFGDVGSGGVNVFKVFNNFFDKSQQLERIGQKLPGYDDDIQFNTE